MVQPHATRPARPAYAKLLACAAGSLFASSYSIAMHPGAHADVNKDWFFTPVYTLPRSASNIPGSRPLPPEIPHDLFELEPPALDLVGLKATGRATPLLSGNDVPTHNFSLEMLVLDHVNQPVGIVGMARKGDGPEDVIWSLGYTDDRAFTTAPGKNAPVRLEADTHRSRLKDRWVHMVLTREDTGLALYVNGEPVGEISAPPARDVPDEAWFEFAAYTENEPYMQLGDLLRSAHMHPRALTADEVRSLFVKEAVAIDQGVLFPGGMQFTAGPYLNHVTRHSMAVLWETDRPTRASISYGITLPLENEVTLEHPERLHEVTLEGLTPGTSYYYRVRVTDSDGSAMDSGLLTFKTADTPGQPISFAVIGDTEARPHINNRLAQLIWDERPDFVLNCGDLTDGGQAEHRFEWTHEYFLAMSQLHSRVPCYPVPGNGESDMKWFTHYHRLPGAERYYTFTQGETQFFMLDSNRASSEFKQGGEQYEWLKDELQQSDTRWKIAVHHHAPFSSDENDYGNTWQGEPSTGGDPATRQLVDLYEQFGVDVVFFGHLHSYERSWPIRKGKPDLADGVVYVQAGGGGGNLEDFAATRNWFKRKSFRGHHYCTVDIAGPRLELRVYDTEGRMRDTLTLDKAASEHTTISTGVTDE